MDSLPSAASPPYASGLFSRGGLSRLVPSNSTGTGLTDHLHLGSPHLNPGGVGLVKTRVFSKVSTDFFVIILASQAH